MFNFKKEKNPIVKKNASKSKIDYDQKSSSGTNSEKITICKQKLGISKSFICVFSLNQTNTKTKPLIHHYFSLCGGEREDEERKVKIGGKYVV